MSEFTCGYLSLAVSGIKYLVLSIKNEGYFFVPLYKIQNTAYFLFIPNVGYYKYNDEKSVDQHICFCGHCRALLLFFLSKGW